MANYEFLRGMDSDIIAKAFARLDDVVDQRVAFMLLVVVNRANPNGDPLGENQPRTEPDGTGVMSPECIRRKMCNYFYDHGYENNLCIVANDRAKDGIENIYERVISVPGIAKAIADNADDASEVIRGLACEHFLDARAFGRVFAFKGKKKKKETDNDESSGGISVGIHGAVTIQEALSVDPVEIITTQIVKSTNSEGTGQQSDRMGTRYMVDHGLYIVRGSVSEFNAQRNGFTYRDLLEMFAALLNLFENDESAARPAGSMYVDRLLLWEGNYSKKNLYKVLNSVKCSVKDDVDQPRTADDYDIVYDKNMMPEVIEG